MVENNPLGIQPQVPQQPYLGIVPPAQPQPQLGVQPPQQQHLGVQPQSNLGIQPQPPPPPPQAFQMPNIDLSQVMRVRPRMFIVDVFVDGVAWRYPTSAMNLESLVAQIAIATSVNMPRVSGWNIYDESGILLLAVSALEFIQQLASMTPVGRQPADPKTAGWRAMPAITPTSHEFQESIEKARKEGRIPT